MVFSVSNQSVTRCHGNILAVMEERGLLRLVEMARGYFFWGVVLTKEPRLLEEGGNWAENVREGRYHIFWGVGYRENEVSWGTRDLGRERKRERERERERELHCLEKNQERKKKDGLLSSCRPCWRGSFSGMFIVDFPFTSTGMLFFSFSADSWMMFDGWE